MSKSSGKLDCYGMSDRGKERPINEDQFLVADLSKSMVVEQASVTLEEPTRLLGDPQGKLLLVADGMGGQPGGDRASSLAVRALASYVLNTMPWFFLVQSFPEEQLLAELKAALTASQSQLTSEMERRPELEGMGTTLTVAYIFGDTLYVVHVGDSRCYLYREGRLHQITRDQTMAQDLVQAGVLQPDEAEDSRWSQVLSSAIGGREESATGYDPEVYKLRLQNKDRLLLCTDGVTKHLEPEELTMILAEGASSQETCQRIVEAANEAGGSDNITVVLARFFLSGLLVEEEDPTKKETRGDNQPQQPGDGDPGKKTPVRVSS